MAMTHLQYYLGKLAEECTEEAQIPAKVYTARHDRAVS